MNINGLVKTFKALGEPTRLKILKLLSIRPMFVCELEGVLQISQPRISQHLRVLKEAGLLKEKKDAQRTFYLLQKDFMQESFNGLINTLEQELEKLAEFQEEFIRLKQLDNDSNVIFCKEGMNCNK